MYESYMYWLDLPVDLYMHASLHISLFLFCMIDDDIKHDSPTDLALSELDLPIPV